MKEDICHSWLPRNRKCQLHAEPPGEVAGRAGAWGGGRRGCGHGPMSWFPGTGMDRAGSGGSGSAHWKSFGSGALRTAFAWPVAPVVRAGGQCPGAWGPRQGSVGVWARTARPEFERRTRGHVAGHLQTPAGPGG